MSLANCACDSGRLYPECCGALHAGIRKAETAEELMRSRYTAYALKLPDYIVATTLPSAQSPTMLQEVESWMQQTSWYRLEVLQTRQGRSTDTTGDVEFRAYYSISGTDTNHHERSHFQKEGEEWFFVNGEVME